jgi:hypothetical protein
MVSGSRPRRRARGFLVVLAALVCALVLPASTVAASAATGVLRTGLPNHTLTPGTTNPAVTQATIHSTICKSGWTATIRPPTSYTNRLKAQQLVAYGYTDRSFADYEEDHLISLELGGSPTSPKNLWPEPHHIRLASGLDVGSYTKDALETHLKREICAGQITLRAAQHEIATNWVTGWKAWKGR